MFISVAAEGSWRWVTGTVIGGVRYLPTKQSYDYNSWGDDEVPGGNRPGNSKVGSSRSARERESKKRYI